ncbi:hypothetical protein AALP_AA7G093300 [Arabis alpina]|uniref:Uncharacterized protein n=1 Tax=Arabis alpina TaxID=50452 RepID=A0A087GGY6_ARAAL|nr:hypothetical protein AALP_AA7G093300 [Arabis alpina]
MSKVDVCEIVAEDSDALDGFKAFVDVIDQFSLVDEESKLFVSDVPQFLHTKMRLKQEPAIAPLESSTSFMIARCTSAYGYSSACDAPGKEPGSSPNARCFFNNHCSSVSYICATNHQVCDHKTPYSSAF